jgi:plasmid stability protein
MATLTIKNFPDALYARLRERAKREHRSLALEVVRLLDLASREPETHSILELSGLLNTTRGSHASSPLLLNKSLSKALAAVFR